MNAEYTSLIRGGADLAGLYKSKYEYGNITVINLVTQFQATDARSVFPCFDEPAFKATFQITVCAPSNAIALSNMPIATRKPNEGVTAECIWTSPEDGTESTLCDDVTFQTTPVMSSYLVALAIGGFRRVNTSIDAVQTVYYPYGFDTKMAEFALTQSERVLSEFNGADGFDIVYTSSGFPKLDSVGVTDFAAGAMENWGLILYRTTRLLVDPELSTQNAKTNQLVTIAHELAHQWFGNLVSPHWWDDLWLSEGFATYMSYYGANLVEPEYNLNEQKLQEITKVLLDDASVFTTPVKQEIEGDPTQIRSKFSSITYQKGMGVLNTIANVVGNDALLDGIIVYLKKYEFKTATSAQLAEVLDTVNEGFPEVSELMDSFIEQEGFPLIFVETELIDDENIGFTIKQQRFVKEGPSFYDENAENCPFVTDEMVEEFEDQLWRVPMLWRDAKGRRMIVNETENDMMKEEELSTTHTRVENMGVEFYLVNPVDGAASSDATVAPQGLLNYFRVFYDDISFQFLVDNWIHLGSSNQLVILSDRFALMAAGYISAESYLDFVKTVVRAMINALTDEDIPRYAVFGEVISSLVYIDDVFCDLALADDYSRDDIALRGYYRAFAVGLLRPLLPFVVGDASNPFLGSNECPVDSDCNELQSQLLRALVRLQDAAVIAAANDVYFVCANRVCANQKLCQGCDAPVVENERIEFVSQDKLAALFAGVLSFDARASVDVDRALEEMIALYDLVDVEQQSIILGAFAALYPNDALVTRALDFILSDAVAANMKVSALSALKTCTARKPLWDYMTSGTPTVFDTLFAAPGVFGQEALTALADGFGSVESYEAVAAFFEADADRTNAGTERIVQQTLENIYTRFEWSVATQPGMEVYMRTYIVDEQKERMTLWEIIIVTVVCCGMLALLVCGFWGIARPSASDETDALASKKHKKRMHRKSSQSLQAAERRGGSYGHSQDRDEVNNRDVVEEMPQAGGGGGGYGATQEYDYEQLKDTKDDQ
eukprot:155396_1